MQETTETHSGKGIYDEMCDAFRYVGDVTYAVLPKDIAHNLGDLKKSFLSTIRTLIDKDIEWIDARVAGGDRVREEWKAKCEEAKAEGGPEPIS